MSEATTYTPELLSRRGEITAWALTAGAAVGIYLLGLRQDIPYWAWVFGGLLLLSAASISLGNWMDRRTQISLDPAGISFTNGLRNTRLEWNAIQEVRTAPARWGTSVQVIGAQAHFSFSTLGEMQFQGQVRGRTGFSAGQTILDEIIRASGLAAQTRSGAFTIHTRA